MVSFFKDLDFKGAAEPPKELTALSEDGARPEVPVVTVVGVDTAARGVEVPRAVSVVVSARDIPAIEAVAACVFEGLLHFVEVGAEDVCLLERHGLAEGARLIGGEVVVAGVVQGDGEVFVEGLDADADGLAVFVHSDAYRFGLIFHVCVVLVSFYIFACRLQVQR